MHTGRVTGYTSITAFQSSLQRDFMYQFALKFIF